MPTWKQEGAKASLIGDVEVDSDDDAEETNDNAQQQRRYLSKDSDSGIKVGEEWSVTIEKWEQW